MTKSENAFRLFSLIGFGAMVTIAISFSKSSVEKPNHLESLLVDLETVEEAHVINSGALSPFSLKNQDLRNSDLIPQSPTERLSKPTK
jgi:hypothetical protein